MEIIKHIVAIYFGLVFALTFVACGSGFGTALHEEFDEEDMEYDDGSYYVVLDWGEGAKEEKHVERTYGRIFTYEGSSYIDRSRTLLGLYDAPTGGTLYVNANGYIVRDLQALKSKGMTLYAVYQSAGQ